MLYCNKKCFIALSSLRKKCLAYLTDKLKNIDASSDLLAQLLKPQIHARALHKEIGFEDFGNSR
jgi:predicted metal-binding protein